MNGEREPGTTLWGAKVKSGMFIGFPDGFGVRAAQEHLNGETVSHSFRKFRCAVQPHKTFPEPSRPSC